MLDLIWRVQSQKDTFKRRSQSSMTRMPQLYHPVCYILYLERYLILDDMYIMLTFSRHSEQ